MAEPALVIAQIKKDIDGKLKVEWRICDVGWPPYAVNRTDLDAWSEEARNELRALVTVVRQYGRDQCGHQLKRLAERGRHLYDVLFARGVSDEWARVSRDWLENDVKPPCRIQVQLDLVDPIHVPWGLVYSGNPTDLSGHPEDCRVDRYRDFWCLKYAVSTLHAPQNITPAMAEAIPIDAGAFYVLPIFHRKVLERAQQNLSKAERMALESFFGNPGYSLRELEERWPVVSDKFGMLYFLCHADGSQLALDNIETIGGHHLGTLTRKDQKDTRTACIVFLNGCATAAGAPNGGFMKAVARQGFYGFIGTESSVPDRFALRYSLAFMNLFQCKGLPIYEAMERLRRQHWPLSLLYSVNCYARLRVTLQEDPMDYGELEEPTLNFSDHPIGTLDQSPWNPDSHA